MSAHMRKYDIAVGSKAPTLTLPHMQGRVRVGVGMVPR
jgi:hypothetical protein